MNKYNEANERIKHKYLIFLKDAKQYSESTVDIVAKALKRFDDYNKYRDFKAFHYEQARGFKRFLAEQRGKQSGEKLSKKTLLSTLTSLKRFFEWLSMQPGYKSRINYSDAEYFNLSKQETRIATAKRYKEMPTLEQIKHVINNMPFKSDIEKRNRALIAFTLLTGARDSAIASLKLMHVNLEGGYINQDARDVKTKFRKTFITYFLPVGDEVLEIVTEWVKYLREEMLWGNEDPLFPATKIGQGADNQFGAVGLERRNWKTTTPIRDIFKIAFEQAGLQYFNPHSFRNTLTVLGEQVCPTMEQFKAWSQNLGHERVSTTFDSYGAVSCQRQGEIIRDLAKPQGKMFTGADEIAEAVFKRLSQV